MTEQMAQIRVKDAELEYFVAKTKSLLAVVVEKVDMPVGKEKAATETEDIIVAFVVAAALTVVEGVAINNKIHYVSMGIYYS